MIRHIVLITFREDADPHAADRLVSALRALPPKIPEILSYEAGKDVVRGNNSADVGLIADFDDIEALDRYRMHPDHKAVVETYIMPHLETISAVDYEVVD